MSGQFTTSDHPLVKHKLAYLRLPRDEIDSQTYISVLREIGILLTAEAVALAGVTFPEPPGHEPPGSKKHWPVIVATVRHGLIMAEGARSIMPTRHMSHIGVFHDLETDTMKDFMVTMPTTNIGERTFFVLDAFAVTGRTAERTIDIVREFDVPAHHIIFVCAAMAIDARDRLTPLATKGVRFHCGHIDRTDSSDGWKGTFQTLALNSRLYGTPNKFFGK